MPGWEDQVSHGVNWSNLKGSSSAPPLVSVVVPTYNRRELVVETLDSIIGQDWPRLEIILVDDGSTDSTASYVREKYGTRVRVLEQRNHGPSIARNVGFREAQGLYLTSMDSDDIMPPGSIRSRVKALVEHGQADAAYGRPIYQRRNGKWRHRAVPPADDKEAWPEGDLLLRYAVEPFFRHTDVLFHRKLRPDDGELYPPAMGKNEDYIMVLKLCARAYFVPCYAVTTLVRAVAGADRLRFRYDRIVQEDVTMIERAIANDAVLSNRLQAVIRKVRARHLRGIADAAWQLGKGRVYRRYARMAKEADAEALAGWKHLRRYLLSFFQFRQ